MISSELKHAIHQSWNGLPDQVMRYPAFTTKRDKGGFSGEWLKEEGGALSGIYSEGELFGSVNVGVTGHVWSSGWVDREKFRGVIRKKFERKSVLFPDEVNGNKIHDTVPPQLIVWYWSEEGDQVTSLDFEDLNKTSSLRRSGTSLMSTLIGKSLDVLEQMRSGMANEHIRIYHHFGFHDDREKPLGLNRGVPSNKFGHCNVTLFPDSAPEDRLIFKDFDQFPYEAQAVYSLVFNHLLLPAYLASDELFQKGLAEGGLEGEVQTKVNPNRGTVISEVTFAQPANLEQAIGSVLNTVSDAQKVYDLVSCFFRDTHILNDKDQTRKRTLIQLQNYLKPESAKELLNSVQLMQPTSRQLQSWASDPDIPIEDESNERILDRLHRMELSQKEWASRVEDYKRIVESCFGLSKEEAAFFVHLVHERISTQSGNNLLTFPGRFTGIWEMVPEGKKVRSLKIYPIFASTGYPEVVFGYPLGRPLDKNPAPTLP